MMRCLDAIPVSRPAVVAWRQSLDAGAARFAAPRGRRWTLALLIAMAGSLAAQPSEPPSPRATDALQGRLVHVRLAGGTWQLFETELATGSTRQLTRARADQRLPTLRSDGAVAWHDVDQEAWLLRPGGSAPEPLLAGMRPLRDLAWSPDGSRVAFTRIRTDLIDAMNLWTAQEDGGEARMLTNDPGVQCHATWSPDGARIAFSAGQGFGSYEIYTIAPDGTGRVRLTDDRHLDFHPAWSPDGLRLAWSSDRGGDFDIWTMAADGSDRRRLTEARGLDSRPVWSPDGTHLAFTSSRGGRLCLWIMRADGSDQRPLGVVGEGVTDAFWGPSAGSPDRHPLRPPTSPSITGTGVHPKTLGPGPSAPAVIRFQMDRRADVTVDLVDRFGVLARRIPAGRLDPGSREVAWDGRDAEGREVPAGVYRYVIRTEDEGGLQVHDLSLTTGGDEILPKEFGYDPARGRLYWIQPRAAMARIRSGLQQFPHLGTILDWEAFEAGAHELPWDGRDASGSVALGDHPDLSLLLWLYALPDNAVIVRGPSSSLRLRGPALYPPLVFAKGAYFHARHQPGACGPIRHVVELPDGLPRNAEGIPIVRGKVPIRVRLDPRDRDRVLAARYEIAVYLDLVFLFEEEDGVDPFTFSWDTGTVAPGAHLLTIDVLAYDDHFGVTTLKVMVEPDR